MSYQLLERRRILVNTVYTPFAGTRALLLRAKSGGGSGGSVPVAIYPLCAAASGGGGGGLSESWFDGVTPKPWLDSTLWGVPSLLDIRIGAGGVVPPPGLFNGNYGGDTVVYDGSGHILCRATGAQPGASLGPTQNNSIDGGGGGNHENAVGDYFICGESGGPGWVYGVGSVTNLVFKGYGGASAGATGGGKGSISTGPGHGGGPDGPGGSGASWRNDDAVNCPNGFPGAIGSAGSFYLECWG